MIHKILIALVLSVCAAAPVTALTDADSAVSAVSVHASIDESYSGIMDVTMSKGKTFKGRKAVFQIRNGKLLCDFPKMGKMPGKIRIELPVKIDGHGNISARPQSEAGVMKMPMGMKIRLKLDALNDARIVGNQLSFRLNIYGRMMGVKFPTGIHFKGKAC